MGSDIRDIISEQFNKIIDVLHEGYILVDEETNIIDANPAYCKMLGYSKEELLSMNLHDVRPDKSLNYQREFIKKVIQEGSVEFETQHRTKSGEIIDLKASAGALKINNTIYLAGFVRDITEQKRAERRLEETINRFQSLFNNNPQPVYYFDLEGNFLGANKRTEEVSGYSEGELLSMNFAPIIVEKDLERTQRHFELAASGSVEVYEIKIQTKQKKVKDLRVTNFPMRYGDDIVGVFGIAEDITEAKQAKKKLKESEQRFKSLFEHNPHSVFYFDVEGNFLNANKVFEELSGYSVEELREKTFAPFIDPDDLEKAWGHFHEALSGKPQHYEVTGIRRSGEKREVRVTNFPIIVGDEIVGVFGIAEDITDAKLAKKKLEESEQRWQHLVEDNPQPVQVTVDGKIVFINKAGAELFGAKSPEEITGISAFKFTHPGFEEKIEERKHRLENNLEVDAVHEHKIIRLDGESRFVEVHSIPIIYQEQKAIQTVIHDITERKKQEKFIKESLSEKEVLLKEIHHRVKNNMAVISGLLQLQAMNTEDPELAKMLEESQLRISSMAMVHEKLYQTETLSDISVDKYIKELVETIRDTIEKDDKDIKITYDLEDLSLDINQAIPCALILNELVVNSFKHAFPKAKEGEIKIGLQNKNGLITFSVKDDGKGLPKDFEFSGLQTLGMTLIQTLADQLGGKIGYSQSSVAQGAEFFIEFPLTK